MNRVDPCLGLGKFDREQVSPTGGKATSIDELKSADVLTAPTWPRWLTKLALIRGFIGKLLFDVRRDHVVRLT
jgi:hypothetical protein